MLHNIISKSLCARNCTKIIRIHFIGRSQIFLNQNQTTLNLRSEYHAITTQRSYFGLNKQITRKHDLENGFSRTNVAFISNFFIKKGEDDANVQQKTRFNFNEHYEKVRSQNFGPVPASETNDGIQMFSTREFALRDHLEFDGLKYHELPVVMIKAKWNNTFVSVLDKNEKNKVLTITCGKVGFKNAKKKTIYAGEMVGKRAAEEAILKGVHPYVRAKLKGAGPGRAASLRGLTMGGMKIVSISDITPLHVDGLPQRPRKIRRI